MLRIPKVGFLMLGAAALFFGGLQPAAAKCQLIRATNSASSKALAAKAAHQNAIDNAYALKRQYGWAREAGPVLEVRASCRHG